MGTTLVEAGIQQRKKGHAINAQGSCILMNQSSVSFEQSRWNIATVNWNRFANETSETMESIAIILRAIL